MLLHFGTRFLCAALLAATAALTIFAQETVRSGDARGKNNYEIRLQVLVTTSSANATAKKLPASLAAIERRLREDFGNANYNLALTSINRVSESGGFTIKGVLPGLQNSANAAENLVVFYDGSLQDIKANPNIVNETSINSLIFGLRIPISVGNPSLNDKLTAPITYERIGITAKPLSVRFNEPTVIGTLSTARADEQIIVVLTVKPDAAQTARTTENR